MCVQNEHAVLSKPKVCHNTSDYCQNTSDSLHIWFWINLLEGFWPQETFHHNFFVSAVSVTHSALWFHRVTSHIVRSGDIVE